MAPRAPTPLVLAAAAFAGVAGLIGCALKPRAVPPAPSPPPVAATSTDMRVVARSLSEEESRDYLGDAACARCHARIIREHAQSRHARTLRRVKPGVEGRFFKGGNTVVDPGRHLTYRTQQTGDRCELQATDGQHTGRVPAQFVLGAGKNAMTFFAESDPNRFVELRLTYYTAKRKWDFTPNQLPANEISGPPGLIHTGYALDLCFLCHTTVLRRDPEGLDMAHSRFGVGCERCHGPGRGHVESVKQPGHQELMERLGGASPEKIGDLCGPCHHSSKDSSLADDRTQRNLPRFQGLALEQSACYKKSGTLSCVTCHDPHQDARTGTAYYDRICMSCHSAAKKQSVCKVNTLTGCTGCHMPRQNVEGVPHAVYRNHWIKAWSSAGKT